MKKKSANFNFLWVAFAAILVALACYLYIEKNDLGQTAGAGDSYTAPQGAASLPANELDSASLAGARNPKTDFKNAIPPEDHERIAGEMLKIRKPFGEIEKNNAIVFSDVTVGSYRMIVIRISQPTQTQIDAAHSEVSKRSHGFDEAKVTKSKFTKCALSLLDEFFYFWKPIKVIRLTIPKDSDKAIDLEEIFANDINDLHFDNQGGLTFAMGGGKGSVLARMSNDFGVKGAKSTERYAHFLDYAKFD